MGHAPFLFKSVFLSYFIYRHRVYLVLTHSLHIRSSSLHFILACTDVICKVYLYIHVSVTLLHN